jgi:hypothetical protein
MAAGDIVSGGRRGSNAQQLDEQLVICGMVASGIAGLEHWTVHSKEGCSVRLALLGAAHERFPQFPTKIWMAPQVMIAHDRSGET